MTQEEANTRAILSLLDVVQELASKVGGDDWAWIVGKVFDSHRDELRFPAEHDLE